MRSKNLFLALTAFLSWAAQATPQPTLVWQYRAESNLYASPVVADVTQRPGLEILLSDCEARRLVCLDARGNLLWKGDGGWKKRLTSQASISLSAGEEGPRALVGNPDGRLVCFEAATGKPVWSREIGRIVWGNALWADVDGDGMDEAVAGTEDRGIVCFRSDGTPIWSFPLEGQGKAPTLPGALAAADLEGDSRTEIFFQTLSGPACLKPDGSLRWQSAAGGYFLGSPVLADADRDGHSEVYAGCADPASICCFDARNGRLLWRSLLFREGETKTASSLAVGDLERDGTAEILVADPFGSVVCLSSSGALQWVYRTGTPTAGGVSIGDVDSDGGLEVLLTSGDRNLYCLSATGDLEWQWLAGRRLLSPATLADLDQDGRTEILFGGMDRSLRVVSPAGRSEIESNPKLYAGSKPPSSDPLLPASPQVQSHTITTLRSLLPNGGFEKSKHLSVAMDFPAEISVEKSTLFPAEGWNAPHPRGAEADFDLETKRSGTHSIRIMPGTSEAGFFTDFIGVPAHLETVTSAVFLRGEATATVWLRWIGLKGLIRDDFFAPDGASEVTSQDGWRKLSLPETRPPQEAHWFQMICSCHASVSEAPVWWDEAQVEGTFQEPLSLQVVVNQVGYDQGAPKRFIAQSNFNPTTTRFEVLSETGEVRFSGDLSSQGRIQGAYGNDWGFNYWRGDFSDFNQSGKYRIRILLDREEALSSDFEIGPNLVWEKTSRLAYRFFYYQRCGMAIPGFHEACHLDDATGPDHLHQFDLAGGWHDAGDYNKYHNAPYVLGLASAYGNRKEVFDCEDEDGNGRSDFFDEILWGGDFSRRMIAPDGSAHGRITVGYGFWGAPEQETDNLPGTGDERILDGGDSGLDSSLHTAAMAKIARYHSDSAPYVEAAERGLAWALDRNQKGPLQLSAALDLYLATRKEKYADLAKEIFPSVGFGDPDLVESYDRTFAADHSKQIRETLVAEAEGILTLARNPFGVYTHGLAENPNFFNTPPEQAVWHLGTNDHLLLAADRMALAYRYQPDPRYLTFVYDQINWILGNNPFDTSLMEGAGDRFVPTYHHRYIFSGVERGAVPGGIINGISWQGPGKDLPELDLSGVDIAAFQTNEVWLPHNTNYLKLLSHLPREGKASP